jgi:uncharacterized protein YcbK (DUF882 family)
MIIDMASGRPLPPGSKATKPVRGNHRRAAAFGATSLLLAAVTFGLWTPSASWAASLPSGAAGARSARGATAAKKGRPRVPTVELYHVNRRETLRLRLADEKGRPVGGLTRRLNNFLRCHHTNKRHAINPRLIRLIYETGRHYADRRIEIVSGYRHPRVAKNPRSPHMKGLACDMRVSGVRNAELRDFLRQRFRNVGVGYYPNSSFVHLDVRRSSSAFWIDYSGPGQTALYSDDPEFDLKSGVADSWKHTTIDPRWAEYEGPEETSELAETQQQEDPPVDSEVGSHVRELP